MITAIPQVTNDSVKTACGEAITDNTGLSLAKKLLKSDFLMERLFDNDRVYISATEYNCTLGDWTTQENSSEIDTSETEILVLRFTLKQMGGGQGQFRVIDKISEINVTHWLFLLGSTLQSTVNVKSVINYCYATSETYKSVIIFVDVSSVDSIELSFQLKQTGGTAVYYSGMSIYKQKHIYSALEV